MVTDVLRDSWPYVGCMAAALAALAALWPPGAPAGADGPTLQAGAWLVLACAVIGVVRNLRGQRAAERTAVARLSYQQAHDSLTGVLNRAEFEQRVA
ncbi:MAG: GGDEF domain-containing protein, partial [Betaproteobacteria bacterium]|nr:GGDEF domain-containing protein [Betaproteobacteria bacterium]